MMPTCTHYIPRDRHCSYYVDGGTCSRPDTFMCIEWLVANGEPLPSRRPDHLSYSQLQLYEACPQAYYRRYVSPTREPGRPAPQLTFGKVLHRVLELVMRHHVQEELVGPLDLDLALRLYQQEWQATYLVGTELYEEGERQLRQAIRERGVVNHWHVLGVEQSWKLQVGSYNLIGVMDLVEREGDVVAVTDYKTGSLPQPWDVDASLQLTLYDIAARELYPWAADVRLELHQLRQGLHLPTARTEEQRAATRAYVEAVGARLDAEMVWPAQVGDHCPICAWRSDCRAWRAILTEPVPQGETLDEVAREHQRLSVQRAATKARMRETEKVLRAALKDEEEIRAGGCRWSLWPVEGLTYPVEETLALLGRFGVSDGVLVVDKDRLSRALDKISDPARKQMAKLELEALARKRIYPRLWSKR